jgi:hypothetical protein
MGMKRAGMAAAIAAGTMITGVSPGLAAGSVSVLVDYGPGVDVSGRRNGEVKTFKLGAVLEAGDQLVIPANGFVRIDRGGACDMVTGASFTTSDKEECNSLTGSTYEIPAQGIAGSASARFQELAQVLNWWDPKRPRKPMRSRDSYRPRVPALDGVDRPVLAEGNRLLEVRWVDGKPPFQLTAITGDGQAVSGSVLEKDRRGTVKVTVKNGETVRLELKAGNQVKTYELLGARDLPVEGMGDAAGDYDRAALILAAISKSGGDLAFEGSQQIAALQLPPRIKQALIDAIQFGDWP